MHTSFPWRFFLARLRTPPHDPPFRFHFLRSMFDALNINVPGKESSVAELSEKEKEDLRQLFALWDADASGELTFDEVIVAMGGFMSSVELKDLQETLSAMDKDRNGQISVDEFFEYVDLTKFCQKNSSL